jgi:hypothetical protein
MVLFAAMGAVAHLASTRADTVPRPVKFTVDAVRRTVTIDDRMTLRLGAGWAPSSREYRNAVEWIAKGAGGTDAAPEARMVVTVERRTSHDEAVDRLGQIASARPAKVTVLSIGGWPAIQLRYREPLAEVAERRGEPGELRESGPVEQALHAATAIAVEDAVVQTHTTVAPKASVALAREADQIAQKATLPARTDGKGTHDEVERLRARPAPAPVPSAPRGDAGDQPLQGRRITGVRPDQRDTKGSSLAALAGAGGETSAGVSASGLNLIIASNGGTRISTDAAATFTTSATATLPFPNRGDPSVAIGRSGNFYLALLGLPGAMAVTNTTGLTGCSAGVISSGNSGAVFAFAGNAALCPATGAGMCSPDQEHIAADRANASAGGGDQLYAVWRNFTAVGTPPANCALLLRGQPTPSLSCSTDSASNWTTGMVIGSGSGDFPRLAAGQDGSVYVVLRDGRDVMVHKYTSCRAGLVEMAGFPRRVTTGIEDTTCPLPGLDRCHKGLIVPTVAVDDAKAAHVYVAVAQSAAGSKANDDILVIDSADGGLTWGAPVRMNSGVTARRFMPWICTAAGNAYVGWYDRRAATAPGAGSNDLTDYFLGAATTRNGLLVADGELNLTGTADAQCASGWPASAGDSADAEGCTAQPQLAGVCVNSAGMGSFTRCDFDMGPACPAGETCIAGGGAPKYGDYNGIACGPDRVLATWASATPPLGFMGTPPAGVAVFADLRRVNGNLTVVERSIPFNDPGRFNVLVDGVVVGSALSNGQAGPTPLSVNAPHQVTQTAAPGTSLANYAVSIQGDCDGNGTVHFSALHPATCRITNVNLDYQRCVQDCNVTGNQCMADAHSIAERQGCVREKLQCTDDCSRVGLTVVKRVVPGTDAGRFNLTIDGVVRRVNAGDGDATPVPARVDRGQLRPAVPS